MIAAACASSAPHTELSGTRWQVVTVGGQAVGSQAPTLEFAGDRIAGSGGCNRYFGAYTMSAETLSINGVGSTEMACDGPVMQREAAYFQALQATRAYRRLGDTLILSDADGGTITLRPN